MFLRRPIQVLVGGMDLTSLSTNFLVILTVASLLIPVAAGPTQAGSPFFSLGEGGDPWFSSPAGFISPVSADEAQEALIEFYSQQDPQPDSVQGRQPTLNADLIVTDDNGVAHDSLVMSWEPNDELANDPDGMHVSVAGFEFEYAEDPDLTGTTILFSLLPPDGIENFSLVLYDAANRKRRWTDNNAPNIWGNQSIESDIAGPQGGFGDFYEDTGFDLTMVTRICLFEGGQRVIVANPDGSALPGYTNWNAWNHLSVVPEPASMTLIGFASLALVLFRRNSHD